MTTETSFHGSAPDRLYKSARFIEQLSLNSYFRPSVKKTWQKISDLVRQSGDIIEIQLKKHRGSNAF